jgi:hypothetical protein
MKMDTWSKQTQTKPILSAYMAGKIALSAVEGPMVNLPCAAATISNSVFQYIFGHFWWAMQNLSEVFN